MLQRHGLLRLKASLILAVLAVLPAAAVDPARFDLTGPKLEVRVTRGGSMLPIASVPNLLPGDKIWLHPDLPPSQSVHYLLVVVFLRGTTNPPPDNWFTRIETWNRKVIQEGVTVTVPEEAQQALLFLAPETGGDFSTLRSAVRGRPGVFVRASQDLAEAGFEQARIEKYLASMRMVPPSDPKALLDHSTLLSRTLNLKSNDECFKRPVDLQYTCLTQSGTQTLLDDGHGQTIVSSLTSGAGSDFISAASATSLAGGGVYSAYVGAVVDLVRLMGGLHTAQYQYIPAIGFPQQESLNLRLNTPPSFHNPKSVIVIGLPAVQPSVTPPLRPTNPKHVTCLMQPGVVLPVEGAPLVFSTSFAHDLVLHINGPHGTSDLPLTPDAFQGGLVLSKVPQRKALSEDPISRPKTAVSAQSKVEPSPSASVTVDVPKATDGPLTGTINGYWGFDPFSGPTMLLQNTPGTDWKLASAASDPLIAGQDNHVVLSSTGSACIQAITVDVASGKQLRAEWKPTDTPTDVDVSVGLRSTSPGPVHLQISQFGVPHADVINAKSFSQPSKLDGMTFHAGDRVATLTGSSIDQVDHVDIDGLIFKPATSGSYSGPGDHDLILSLAEDSKTPGFKAGDQVTSHVVLKDGRTFNLPLSVAPARPSLSVLSRSIQSASASPIQLTAKDDVPLDAKLTFFLKSSAPFLRSTKIEIENSDGSLQTSLTIAAGTLVMQDSHTVLGSLDPLKTFGLSAFGPIRLRAVAADGTVGDWIPLATLVRLPALSELHCPQDVNKNCTLTGTNLYLVSSISSDDAFSNPVTVPEGFIGSSLAIPHPTSGAFFVRLRDDPSASDGVTLPVLPQQ